MPLNCQLELNGIFFKLLANLIDVLAMRLSLRLE